MSFETTGKGDAQDHLKRPVQDEFSRKSALEAWSKPSAQSSSAAINRASSNGSGMESKDRKPAEKELYFSDIYQETTGIKPTMPEQRSKTEIGLGKQTAAEPMKVALNATTPGADSPTAQSPRPTDSAPAGVAQAEKPPGESPFFIAKKQPSAELLSLVPPEKPALSANKTLEIQGDLSKLDPSKPTVAFLELAGHTEAVIDRMSLTHAMVSSIGAAKNGYNAIILGESDNDNDQHTISEKLQDVAATIAKGALPLSKGDVLNASVGQLDVSFDELNKHLKPFHLQITPESLRGDRTKILAALQKIASDPKNDWQWRAKEALSSNKAIADIQAKGIEVLHAAGNNGPDHLDLGFLMAAHQVKSVDPNSDRADKTDPFSGKNSLTDASGNGVFEIRRIEPGKYQMGNFTITANDLCALDAGNCRQKKVTNELWNNGSIYSPPQLEADYKSMGRKSTSFDTPQGHLLAVVSGTSFANVDYLATQLDRLTAEKQASKR